MKIAVVSPMIYPCPAIKGGAVERLTQYLAEQIAKNGNIVDLYTIYAKGLQEKYKYKNLNLIQIKINPLIKKFNILYEKVNHKIFKGKLKFYNAVYKKTAKKVAKNNNYDYIIVENEMVLYNYIYKYNKNSRMIYHMHNDFYALNRTPKCYSIISNTAFKILTVSDYIKCRCQEVKNTNNIHTLYNCIDTEIFNDNETQNYRKEYGINETDIVIGFAGRMIREKGILELVRAFKKIKTTKELKLLIVGSKDYENLKKDKYVQEIYDEIESMGDKVIFTGHVNYEKMPKIYNTMDVLAIPSMWEEPFGCVAIEGMAMGIPIVATKSGGLAEIISEKNGFIIDKNKEVIDNLAEKLGLLVNSHELRDNISNLTRQDFKEHKEYNKENYYYNFMKNLK